MNFFTKGLRTLWACAMALCVVSAGFVSCSELDDLESKHNELADRVAALEQAQAKLVEDLAAAVESIDKLYTLSFSVNAENSELLYSFDGGETWTATGVYIYEPTECEVKGVVDNGDSVTITIGESQITINKPQEISFEIRAGKVYFASEETLSVSVKTSGIDDLSVMSYPKGWYATITDDGKIEVTAPEISKTERVFDYETWTYLPGEYPAEGFVKVHAAGVDGTCRVGKLAVAISAQGLTVKAYDGQATLTYPGYYTYYYGVAKKADYLAEATAALDAINNSNYNALEQLLYGEMGETVVSFADVLGYEPEVGEEYVLWAILDDYNSPYDTSDLVLAFYSPLNVKVSENAEKNTPYNVEVSVEVEGAEGYIALAMPLDYMYEGEDAKKEEIVMNYTMGGSAYGKYYTSAYHGSLLDICAGTQYSMSGNYNPNTQYYLFIMPIDGRPADAYTIDCVKSYVFKTGKLAAGGSIALNAEVSTKKMEFSYETYEFAEVDCDPYTELSVKYAPAQETGWVAIYTSWVDADTYAGLDTNTKLVNYLVENAYAIIPDDNKSFPAIDTYTAGLGGSAAFIGFVVDETGKYSEVVQILQKTKEMTYSDLTLSVVSNLTNGVLKNTNTLVLDITPSKAVSKYVYMKKNISNYDQWEGLTGAAMVEAILDDYQTTTLDDATVLAAATHKLELSGNNYGYKYLVAVLAFDAEGCPMAEPYVVRYDAVFALDNVISDASKFVGEPTITFHAASQVGEANEGPCYYYEYQSYYDMYNFYYECNYTVEPVAGTTVTSVLVRTGEDYYTVSADASVAAGEVMQGKYGSYYTYEHTEKTTTDVRLLTAYQGTVPTVQLLVVWTDAAGNHYYKSIDCSAEYARMAAELEAALPQPETPAL